MISQIRVFKPIDEQILQQCLSPLEEWITSTPPERIEAMVANGEIPQLLAGTPADLQKEIAKHVNWAKRHVARARIMVARPDLYLALLERIAARGAADRIQHLQTLQGGLTWYNAAMEAMRATLADVLK